MGQIRSRDADEEDGEGKQDVIERAEDQKDRMKYAGLGSGRVGARKGGGKEVNLNGDDECETSGSSPKIEKGNQRLNAPSCQETFLQLFLPSAFVYA